METKVGERTSIDVEGDLDLGNALGCRGDANEVEVTEELVVRDELTLSLEDLDLDSGLAVSSGGEDLGLLGGDGGVTGDELGHDTAESFNTYIAMSLLTIFICFGKTHRGKEE
jgi:hypothetical protein